MSTISDLKICIVCIHILVYKHSVLKLILTFNLNVKWNEIEWFIWNEMFGHYQTETRRMKLLILTLSCGKFLQNLNVHVEQLDFNKTIFLEFYGVLLQHFWATSCSWSLSVCVSVCKLTFQWDEGYQAC